MHVRCKIDGGKQINRSQGGAWKGLERKQEQCLKKFHRKKGRKLTKIENGNKGTLQKTAEGKRNTRSPMTTHSKQDVIMLTVMVAQL